MGGFCAVRPAHVGWYGCLGMRTMSPQYLGPRSHFDLQLVAFSKVKTTDAEGRLSGSWESVIWVSSGVLSQSQADTEGWLYILQSNLIGFIPTEILAWVCYYTDIRRISLQSHLESRYPNEPKLCMPLRCVDTKLWNILRSVCHADSSLKGWKRAIHCCEYSVALYPPSAEASRFIEVFTFQIGKAWWITVHGDTKSQTLLTKYGCTTYI